MSTAMVFRVMSLIPERTPRAQSGSLFDLPTRIVTHPERIALITRFLDWLGPLDAADQGRPAAARPALERRPAGGRRGEDAASRSKWTRPTTWTDESLSDEDRSVRLPGTGTADCCLAATVNRRRQSC